MRYRVLLLPIVVLLAFCVWAVWIADDGRGLLARYGERPVHAKLVAKLAEPATLDAENVPLRDLLARLSAQHDIEICIDEDGLKAAGLTGNEPVTARVEGTSLWSAIKIALRLAAPILCVVTDGELLVVTDFDSATAHPRYNIGRVYPLAPILLAPGPCSEDDLAAFIRSAFAPGFWSDQGGVAEIEVLPAALAVAGTFETQVQIEALLKQLQQVADGPIDSKPVTLVTPIAPGNARAWAALDQPVTIHFVDMPLPELCHELTDRLGVPVLLDDAAVETELDPDLHETRPHVRERKVTLVANDQRLGGVLRDALNIPGPRHAFHRLEPRLTVTVHDEAIWITPELLFDDQPVICFFPVSDLLSPSHQPGVNNLDELAALLRNIVAIGPWGDRLGAMENIGGALVVSQTLEVHREIEQLFRRLRQMLDPMATDSITAAPATPSRVEAVLAENTSIRADKTPLIEVLDDLQRRHRIDIRIADGALEGVGTVTFHAEDIPLEHALYRFLEPLDLSFVVRGKGLEITTRRAAQFGDEVRLYNVRHLVDPDIGIADAEQLLDLVTHLFYELSREDRGRVHSFDGVLVVSAERYLQHEVAAFLETLSRYQRQPESVRPISVAPMQRAGAPFVSDAIRQVVSVQHDDVPLQVAVADFSKRFELPIDIDWKRLEEAGIDRHVPVSVAAHNVSRGAALDVTLRKQRLISAVRLGWIVVTAPGQSTPPLMRRLYPARDILYHPKSPPNPPPGPDFDPSDKSGVCHAPVDYDRLMRILTDTVEPETWVDVGHVGMVQPCEGGLVVSQTWQVHQRIERLLAQIRHLYWPARYPDSGLTPVERVLEQRTTLQSNGASLEDFLADLARTHQITIELPKADPSKSPVRCHFEDVPLGEALSAVVRPIGLELCVDGEVLYLCGAHDGSRPLLTRVYDVRTLVAPGVREPSERPRLPPVVTGLIPVVGGGVVAPATVESTGVFGNVAYPPKARETDIVEFVVQQVSPDTWTDLNHRGTIMRYRGLLVVYQDWQVHRELRALLDLLSQATGDLPPVERLTEKVTLADVDTLLGFLSSAQDDRVLAYVAFLLYQANPPAEMVLPGLAVRFRDTSPATNPGLHDWLCRIFGAYKSDVVEVVPLLIDRLRTCSNARRRAAILKAVVELGGANNPAVCEYYEERFAAHPIDEVEWEAIEHALSRAGPAAVAAVEPLLRLLLDADRDPDDQAIHVLVAIDPTGDACRRIAGRWKNAKDEETRQSGHEAEEKIRDIFGDP